MQRDIRRVRTSAAGLAVAAAALSSTATAAPAAAYTVAGAVARPAKVAPPEGRHNGFLPPLENPIIELRQYDPFPECFVYLDGGPAAADAGAPPRTSVVWQLESNSFGPPILPVVSGTTVEIANVGRDTHQLITPDTTDLLPKDPIGPGSSRTFTVAGDRAIRVLSRASPHVEGRVVPLPSRYFSRIDRSGRFKIENGPAGRWNVKLWYRDGWAPQETQRTIEVPSKEYRIDLGGEAFAPR